MRPNAEWPAIFYAPHQDDEAIAMAGAIAEHKSVGRPVYLVLLTDGHPGRRMREILNGQRRCPWHRTTHTYGLTVDQMIWARTVEFLASARQLHVDRVFIAASGGLSDQEAYADYGSFKSRVRNTILEFEARYPGASHKLISGWHDTLNELDERNPTHRACWDAAMELRPAISDFRMYRVYVYDKPKLLRIAQRERQLAQQWRQRKQAALDEYKLFNPSDGRYAYGYHSVGTLIDAALGDEVEYMDDLE